MLSAQGRPRQQTPARTCASVAHALLCTLMQVCTCMPCSVSAFGLSPLGAWLVRGTCGESVAVCLRAESYRITNQAALGSWAQGCPSLSCARVQQSWLRV